MLDMNIMTLPTPQKNLKFPLMKALELRRTKRKWTDAPLSLQEISNILWVACGVNQISKKKKSFKRTAPSACNSQEIKVYIALAKGLFLYDERNHQLVQTLKTDIREHIGTQKMMHTAPLALIFVSDYSKMTNFVFKDENRKWYTSAADTGFISQNIYLYCVAANLSTAVLGLVDRPMLEEIMCLNENEKVVYTQVVGKTPEDFNSLEIPSFTTQAEFDQLFNKLISKNSYEAENALYILTQLSAETSCYLNNRSAELVELISITKNTVQKRNLATIASKVEFSDFEIHIIWEYFSHWVLDKKESRIVRANSVEALYVLSSKHTELTKDFETIVANLSSERIPSIYSRLKKLKVVN